MDAIEKNVEFWQAGGSCGYLVRYYRDSDGAESTWGGTLQECNALLSAPLPKGLRWNVPAGDGIDRNYASGYAHACGYVD